ncbi:MAG: ABC transporter substrate-binding protein [Thermomicrobiales bacterium]
MSDQELTSTAADQRSDAVAVPENGQKDAAVRRLSRRAVLGSTAFAGLGLAIAFTETGARKPATPSGAASSSPAPATPKPATPAATPVASPAATPAGTPLPAPALKVVTDQSPSPNGSPKAGGTLNLFIGSKNVSQFNPTSFKQDFLIPVSYMDPLVWADEVTMEPKPGLAESWKWNATGKELQITLRQGVQWHDGTALTSDDVVFSFDAYQNDYDSVSSTLFAAVNSVKADGKQTVHVAFDDVDGAFVFNACTLPIFQKAQYAKHWKAQTAPDQTLSDFDWTKSKPIGTGPWKFDEIGKDAISFVANDTYWDGRPYADRLVLTIEDDQKARLKAWKSGKADVVYPVSPDDAMGLMQEHGTLYVADAPTVFFASFNFNNPANATADMMKDASLREALTLSIDRESYAKGIFHGFIAEGKAGTITQPWAHDESLKNPTRDVTRAKKLLKDGGWSDIDGDGLLEDAKGNKLDLYCIVSTAERPEYLALLDGLNANLTEIGARLTIQKLDPDAFTARWVSDHQFDMVAFSLTQYPAFAEFDLYGTAWDVRTNTSGWNAGGYSDMTVDQAIAAWLKAYEVSAMRDALKTLQEAANKNLFGLWFGFPNDLILVREHIQGYRPNKMWQTWDTRLLWDDKQTATPPPLATPSPAVTRTPTVVPSPARTSSHSAAPASSATPSAD